MGRHTGEELEIIALIERMQDRRLTAAEAAIALAQTYAIGELSEPPDNCPPGTWWRRGGKLDVLKKLPQAFRPSDCPAPPPLVRFPPPPARRRTGAEAVDSAP